MRLLSKLYKLRSVLAAAIASPTATLRAASTLGSTSRGYQFADSWFEASACESISPPDSDNPLYSHFSRLKEGPGIVKWTHYFEAYHRHLSLFRGTQVNLLEIGIFSGGSLPMWLEYLGDRSQVWGIDIEPACKCYEAERINVVIGDQQDRSFWKKFRENSPPVNILIDDGGHTPEQQMVTLEEMLPHMPAGSVYVCEDIHGNENQFAAFATALVHRLNRWELEGSKVATSGFQRAIHSIHFYPFMCVIEKHAQPPRYLCGESHGTEWQPFAMGK